MSEANETAFPVEKGNRVAMDGTILGPGILQGGLSKREYFAAMAMQGILCSPGEHMSIVKLSDERMGTPQVFANIAIQYADALIAELEKEKK